MHGTRIQLAILLVVTLTSARSISYPTERGEAIRKRGSEDITERIPSWIGTISIGTNNQSFRVILDTGSGTLAVKGSNCSSCVEEGGSIYDPTQSSPTYFDCQTSNCASYSDAQCTDDDTCLITTSYGDGSSWTGLAINDTMNTAGVNGVQSSMVYWANASQSFLNTYSDGIMGLGYPPLGFPASPITDLLLENNLPNIFWLGFNVDGSGVMTLGDADPQFYTGSLQTIPVTTYPNTDTRYYYQVVPDALIMDDISMGSFDNQLVIIDSGTTVLLLATNIYTPLMDQFQSAHSDAPCYDNFRNSYTCQMSDSDFDRWPTIYISFADDVVINVTSRDYIQPVAGYGYQWGIGDAGTDSQTLLGDPFMTGKYMGFDRDNNQVLVAASSGVTTTS